MITHQDRAALPHRTRLESRAVQRSRVLTKGCAERNADMIHEMEPRGTRTGTFRLFRASCVPCGPVCGSCWVGSRLGSGVGSNRTRNGSVLRGTGPKVPTRARRHHTSHSHVQY